MCLNTVCPPATLFECALSVNEAGECGGVGVCQLLWRAG